MYVLQPARAGISWALNAAVLWTLCSAAVAIAPGPAMWVTGHMLHAEFGDLGWQLDWAGFAVGLVAWTALAWLFGTGVTWTHRRLASRRPALLERGPVKV